MRRQTGTRWIAQAHRIEPERPTTFTRTDLVMALICAVVIVIALWGCVVLGFVAFGGPAQ